MPTGLPGGELGGDSTPKARMDCVPCAAGILTLAPPQLKAPAVFSPLPLKSMKNRLHLCAFGLSFKFKWLVLIGGLKIGWRRNWRTWKPREQKLN
jgi:hypothetical protein